MKFTVDPRHAIHHRTRLGMKNSIREWLISRLFNLRSNKLEFDNHEKLKTARTLAKIEK